VTLEGLCAEQERWRALLRNPAKLRAAFREAPAGDEVRPADKIHLHYRRGMATHCHFTWSGRASIHVLSFSPSPGKNY